jgi:hypothetical protein
VAINGKALRARRRYFHGLVNRLLDGPKSGSDHSDKSDLLVAGMLLRLAAPSFAELVGKRLVPADANRSERRSAGEHLLNRAFQMKITDPHWPVYPIRETLEELFAEWQHGIEVFAQLSDAFYCLRIGTKVPLLTPAKPPTRPPNDAVQKVIFQTEILASLRYREVLNGKGQLTSVRKRLAELVGRDPTSIRDWESAIRRSAPLGVLEEDLANAERLALRVKQAKGREQERLTRFADNLYGDASVRESALELNRLLRSAKQERTLPRRGAKSKQ